MRDKVFLIAEIGINHNGCLETTKKLIDGASLAGCDAVKFQKRTIDVVYEKQDLDRPRESPWGSTNREQKNGLEFGKKEYDEIDAYCKEKGIEWFASAWDIDSQYFMRQYDLKYNKVASAMLTDRKLLEAIAEEGKYTFISTGMSTMEQIEKAVQIFKDAKCPYEVMHCNSSYPMKVEDANLNVMETLRAAAALGATSIERHITLDRSMYGSDQAASLELVGLSRLSSYVRDIEAALGTKDKVVTDKEKEIAAKLRKVDTL